MRVRVFLSSSMTGELDAERAVIRSLFQDRYLADLCELFAIEESASARTIEEAFLDEVRSSDTVVVLLGDELRSAVAEEFACAQATGKRLLCYVRSEGANRSESLKEFIRDQAYRYHVGHFTDAVDLGLRLKTDIRNEFVRALRRTAQDIAIDQSTDSFVLRKLRTPYASTAFFSPADVQELLSRESYGDCDASQLVALGMLILEESGNYLGALLHLEAALARDPRDWMALANRGTVLLEMGLLPQATLSFELALRQKPDNASAEYSLGNAYYTSGDYQRALVHYDKAIAIEPHKESAISRVAVCYLQMGRAEDALVWARKACDLDASDTNRANLALALGLSGERDAAMREVASIPSSPRVNELVAFIERHSEQYEACIAAVDEYEKAVPSSTRASSVKFESLVALGRQRDAEDYLCEIEERLILGAVDLNNYGHQLMETFGASEFVARCFRRSVELDPSLMAAWQNLQACLGDMDDIEGSLEACDEALKSSPYDQKSIQNKAICLRELGRLTEFTEFVTAKSAGLLGPQLGVDPSELLSDVLATPQAQLLNVVESFLRQGREE